jgi:hypothetical protein
MEQLYKPYLRLLVTSVFNMFKNLSATDFARATTQMFTDQSYDVRTTFPQL